MKHPLIGKRIILYGGFWVLVIVLHSLVLFAYYELPVKVCVFDSITFNFLVASFCLSYWYVVKFVSPANQGLSVTITTHLIGAGVSVLLLSYLAIKILGLAIPSQDYHSFLDKTFLPRIFLGLLYFIIIIMLYYLLIYVASLEIKEEKEAQLQNQLRQSELDMLKFQINPHFLFNSLNSISALTMVSPSQAREMVIKLADFFRASLGLDNLELHTLREELNQMNLYLDIEKIRFGDRLDVQNDIEEDCYPLKVPRMILQPIYENAIKYGMYDQLGQNKIKTQCHCRNGFLRIAITNNYDQEVPSNKGNGIGLKNVADRLELVYELPQLIKITKEQNLFTITLTIPQA